MEDNGIEVMFHCYSEKDQSACCGFGIVVHSLAEKDLLNSFNEYPDYFADGFMEMAREFEPGFEKAEVLFKEGRFDTLGEAIKEVFGHFKMCYEYNDVQSELNWNVDEDMYSMIYECFGVES